MASVYIGTSGWHYEHWKGPFYPSWLSSGDMLSYYGRHFRSVEINNSFYRLPTREQFRAWHDQSPPGFVFSVKGSRFITHLKHLKDPAPALELLFKRTGALKEKMGPVLFQLPPRWKLNIDRFREFLGALPRHRFAFEFRDPSWFRDEVTEALQRRGAAFCVYQLAGKVSPLIVTADFVYVRLHGPAGAYQGRYSDGDLRGWARLAWRWRSAGKDIYFYFDNDQAGFAAQDAARFARALESQNGSVVKRTLNSSLTNGGRHAEKEKNTKKEKRGHGRPRVGRK